MVAHQRKFSAGELYPNLVTAAGVQADAHQGGFSGGQTLEFQPGLFYTPAFPVDHVHLVLPAVLPQQVFPVPGFRGTAMHQGHIFFDHRPLLYRPAQSRGSLTGLGIDHNAAHVFVQTVNGEYFTTQGGGDIEFRVHSHRLDAYDDVFITIQQFHSPRSFPESIPQIALLG